MSKTFCLSRFNRFRYRKRLSIGRDSTIAPSAAFSIDPDSHIRLGARCRIRHGALLATVGGWIEIGDGVSVNPYAILYGHGGLKIGNGVRIAAHCVIVPANHVFDRTDIPITEQGLSTLGIEIGDDVWIGANSVVLDGAIIASGCVIAAGSVVRGRTEPFAVYGGVPARKIKARGA